MRRWPTLQSHIREHCHGTVHTTREADPTEQDWQGRGQLWLPQQLPMMAEPQIPPCIGPTRVQLHSHLSSLWVAQLGSCIARLCPGLCSTLLPISRIPCAGGSICAVRHCHTTAASPLCCQCLACPVPDFCYQCLGSLVADFCCDSNLWQGCGCAVSGGLPSWGVCWSSADACGRCACGPQQGCTLAAHRGSSALAYLPSWWCGQLPHCCNECVKASLECSPPLKHAAYGPFVLEPCRKCTHLSLDGLTFLRQEFPAPQACAALCPSCR